MLNKEIKVLKEFNKGAIEEQQLLSIIPPWILLDKTDIKFALKENEADLNIEKIKGIFKINIEGKDDEIEGKVIEKMPSEITDWLIKNTFVANKEVKLKS